MEAESQSSRDKKEFEDCYYFLYSSCKRGDQCAFRHNIAAKSSLKLCPVWDQTKECTKECPDRHSYYHMQKKRSSDFCYFETTPAGCTKQRCEFKHVNPEKDLWKTDNSPPKHTFPSWYSDPSKLAENRPTGENFLFTPGPDLRDIPRNSYYDEMPPEQIVKNPAFDNACEKIYYARNVETETNPKAPTFKFRTVAPKLPPSNSPQESTVSENTTDNANSPSLAASTGDQSLIQESPNFSDSQSLHSPQPGSPAYGNSYFMNKSYFQQPSGSMGYYNQQSNYYTSDDDDCDRTNRSQSAGKGEKVYEDVIYFQNQIDEEEREIQKQKAAERQYANEEYNYSYAMKSGPTNNYFAGQMNIPSKMPMKSNYNYQNLTNEQQYNMHQGTNQINVSRFAGKTRGKSPDLVEYDLKDKESPPYEDPKSTSVANNKNDQESPTNQDASIDKNLDRYEIAKRKNGNKMTFYSSASKTPIKSYGYAKQAPNSQKVKNGDRDNDQSLDYEDSEESRKQLKNNSNQRYLSAQKKHDLEFIERISIENRTLNNEIAELEDEIAWVSQFLNKIQNNRRR